MRCANTQSAASAWGRSTFGISHTSHAKSVIQETREALKLSWRYIEEFEAEAATMMHLDGMEDFARQLGKLDQATPTPISHRLDRCVELGGAPLRFWVAGRLLYAKTASPTIVRRAPSAVTSRNTAAYTSRTTGRGVTTPSDIHRRSEPISPGSVRGSNPLSSTY